MFEIQGLEALNSVYMGMSKLKRAVDGPFTVLVFFSVFTSSLAASNPLRDELCKGMFCGEGRCQGTDQFPFVQCICNPGWSTFLSITSLPCVLPNCTVHSQCGNAAPAPPPLLSPAPPLQPPNISDPCWINYCGADGRCVRNGSDFKCQCSQGSANFLNNPKFACFKKCNLGEDCKSINLGFDQAPPPFASSPLANLVPPTNDLAEGLLCGVAFCGEGRCQGAKDFPFVECICNEGWANLNNDTHLPCVLPNCTVDFHCGNGSPPPPPPPPPSQFQLLNISDPCWVSTICGPEGSCEREGSDHHCQCFDGSANLFGNPKLPCFNKCHFGADCSGFGLGFNQPPPPPTNSVSPTNGDILNGLGKLYMLSVAILAAFVLSI